MYFWHKLTLADKPIASFSEDLIFRYLQGYCAVLIGVVQVPEDLVGIRWNKVVTKVVVRSIDTQSLRRTVWA